MRIKCLTVAIGLLVAIAMPEAAMAETIRASLRSLEEVPAVLSGGHGEIEVIINATETGLEYRLTYQELAGNLLQAHLHFAQRGVNGGIVLFLCTNLGNGPPGTPACPPSPADVTGTADAAEIIGAVNQGVLPGDLAGVIEALRAGSVYANVHTNVFPAGEIRGQLRPLRR